MIQYLSIKKYRGTCAQYIYLFKYFYTFYINNNNKKIIVFIEITTAGSSYVHTQNSLRSIDQDAQSIAFQSGADAIDLLRLYFFSVIRDTSVHVNS